MHATYILDNGQPFTYCDDCKLREDYIEYLGDRIEKLDVPTTMTTYCSFCDDAQHGFLAVAKE